MKVINYFLDWKRHYQPYHSIFFVYLKLKFWIFNIFNLIFHNCQLLHKVELCLLQCYTISTWIDGIDIKIIKMSKKNTCSPFLVYSKVFDIMETDNIMVNHSILHFRIWLTRSPNQSYYALTKLGQIHLVRTNFA